MLDLWIGESRWLHPTLLLQIPHIVSIPDIHRFQHICDNSLAHCPQEDSIQTLPLEMIWEILAITRTRALLIINMGTFTLGNLVLTIMEALIMSMDMRMMEIFMGMVKFGDMDKFVVKGTPVYKATMPTAKGVLRKAPDTTIR